MAFLYGDVGAVSPYLQARQQFYTPEAWTKMINALKRSTTLYIGNLSFYTDEEQVYTLFSLCGPVRRVIMGIHKFTHLPCGFCFVEYYFHRDAMAARDYLNGTKLDDRIIRVDMDPGFEPDRQFGRGTSGGQVRDDRRHEYDEGRGGLPPRRRRELERHAVASGTLVGPTAGPLHTNRANRHRYERNMEANPNLRAQPERRENAVPKAPGHDEAKKEAPPRDEPKKAEPAEPDHDEESKTNAQREDPPDDKGAPEKDGGSAQAVDPPAPPTDTAPAAEDEAAAESKEEAAASADGAEPAAKKRKLE